MLDWLFSNPLAKGTAAPDFSLVDETGRPWRLGDLRGRYVLLVFYPGDDTPGCTKQLCEIRDHSGEWQKRDVQVFGISPQNSRSHSNFIRKYGFKFPLLVDSGQQVAKLYQCHGLFIKRTVYLIGKDGRILFGERGMPSTSEILRKTGI
jgi:peroxiredoxin Q/BCP